MGFKDRLSGLGETVERLKQQAAVLADQAQQGYGTATARLDQYQAKKQADALLLELGGLVWAEHQQRATADASARVAAIMDELADLEAKGVSVVVTPATPPPGSTGTWIPGGVGETAGAPSGETVGPAPTAPAAQATFEPGPSAASPMPEGTYGSEDDPAPLS